MTFESEEQLLYIAETVRSAMVASNLDLKRGSKREAVGLIRDAIESGLTQWPAHRNDEDERRRGVAA